MKTLQTYIECDLATPASTLGMGNPGEIAQDTLTEPIETAKSQIEKDKKKRKKKMKSLSESLFNKDIITSGINFGDLFELDNVKINEKISRPNSTGWGARIGDMKDTKFTLGDMYKTTLLSKDSGQKVTKDPDSIVAALDKLICDIQITPEIFESSLYDFNQTIKEYKKYYSSTLLRDRYLYDSAFVWVSGSNTWDSNNKKDLFSKVDYMYISFFHITLKYKRK